MATQLKQPATPAAPRGRKAVDTARHETHSERLERLANEADGVTQGDDLGRLSVKERRKRLFG